MKALEKYKFITKFFCFSISNGKIFRQDIIAMYGRFWLTLK